MLKKDEKAEEVYKDLNIPEEAKYKLIKDMFEIKLKYLYNQEPYAYSFPS